jgi:hypothetical protein
MGHGARASEISGLREVIDKAEGLSWLGKENEQWPSMKSFEIDLPSGSDDAFLNRADWRKADRSDIARSCRETM